MLSGRLIVPPSDAFGRCFERRAVPLRPFELGFDQDSLTDPPRIVSGLVPGSAAARAGLQNGDAILERVPLYDAQNEPDMTLTLEVRRDGEELEIEYLPRGEPVGGYQWFRRSGVSDTECQLR
jgi:S1-C subfamily serine protease